MKYILITILFAGVGLGVADIGLNTSHQMEVDGYFGWLSAGVIVLGIAALFLLPAGGIAAQSRRYDLTFLCMVAWIFASAFSLSASFSRSSGSIENKMDVVKAGNVQADKLDKQIKRIENQLIDDRKQKAAECSSGFGPKCDGWTNTVKATEAKLAELENKRAAAGVKKTVSPEAARFALMTGLPAERYTTYQPTLLPLALYFGGMALVAVGMLGFNTRLPEPAQELPEGVRIRIWIDNQKKRGKPHSADDAAEEFGISRSSVYRKLRVVK